MGKGGWNVGTDLKWEGDNGEQWSGQKIVYTFISKYRNLYVPRKGVQRRGRYQCIKAIYNTTGG